MTYSVYQHWDTLKVCVVGRCYPPEFFSWIQNPRVRELFERIAIETEEDFQNLIRLLESFDVKIIRPELPEYNNARERFQPPPVDVRDFISMIHNTLYQKAKKDFNFKEFYANVKDPSWGDCSSLDEFKLLPSHIQDECYQLHRLEDSILRCQELNNSLDCYNLIFDQIKNQGNEIKNSTSPYSNWTDGSMVNCLGNDLYIGTFDYNENQSALRLAAQDEFPNIRTHVINTGGHLDGTYVPVTPGLIFSLKDIPDYDNTYPGWEVIWLEGEAAGKLIPKIKNIQDKKLDWWIPGFENDQDVNQTIELFLKHWTGFVEETIFAINMLHIDQKNIIVSDYNKITFDAFQRHGITPHVISFRHRHFWDSGIHCITSELHRDGSPQNWFLKE